MTSASRDRAIAIFVTALAVVSRVPSLVRGGLWRDQANVYVQELAPTFSEFSHRLIATEYHPPLYFVLAFGFRALFGTSEFAYLILPFFFSVATVGIVYRLGAFVGSQRVGLIAASLYAIAPLAVEDATNYLYPQMAFFSTLLTYVVVRWQREGIDSRRWIVLALVSTCVVYTHYAALLFVPIVAASSMIGRRPLFGRIVLASALLAGLATFVAWSPVFFAQRSVGTPYGATVALVDRLLFGLGNVLKSMPTSSLKVAAGMLGVTFALTLLSLNARKLDPTASLVGGIYVVTVGALSFAGLLEPRYIAPFCGLLFVYVAVLVNDVFLRLENAAMPAYLLPTGSAALALLLVVPNLMHASAINRIPRSGISALGTSRALDPGALYVIAPDYLVATFVFYTQKRAIAYLGFARTEHSDVFALDGYEKLWAAKDVVDRTVVKVARLATTHARIHYLVDRNASDRGHMRYSKVWQLLNRLRGTYSLEGITEYRGRQETVDDYLFVKRHSLKKGLS